jgi:WW domain-containing oxidoreductase
MACRSVTKAQDAKGAILREKPDARIDLIQLDLANLKSVEDCAKEYIAKGWPLHCLILNAGLYNPEQRVTVDQFEGTFQANHLGHFLLTNLLTSLLIASAPSRIVVVSSEAHRTANVFKMTPDKITWDFLSPVGEGKIMNSAYQAYGISKLCNIWHAHALQERLASKGVTVGSLHPGMIKTNITNNSKLLQNFLTVAKPWMKNIEQGAATTVFVAVTPELNPNSVSLYYDDCKARTCTGTAQRLDNAEKLWALSEEMLQKRQIAIGAS